MCLLQQRDEKMENWVRVANCRLCSVTVNYLSANLQYKFRVSAENVFGVSDPCELAHFVMTHKEPDKEKDLQIQEAKKKRQKQLDG